MEEVKKLIGQAPDKNDKCTCERCGKRMASIQFYTYQDGSKCEVCKPCLTAHIDNFDPSTFEWVLQKMDVPYIPTEWNAIRDKAFAKNPYKMTGMSVLGKYLSKMKLRQFKDYRYADSARAIAEVSGEPMLSEEEKKEYEAKLKTQLEEGTISLAEYETKVSTETQREQMPAPPQWGNAITGANIGKYYEVYGAPANYNEAMSKFGGNYFQEDNYIPESELEDPGADLDKEDKIHLAMKWGRLYKPNEWLYLEGLYKEFMESFDIRGAARINTLKMICKTSLNMDKAIDSGDTDTYGKLSKVYDTLMKSARFTEAQKKDTEGGGIDSASALVNFVEANSGQIPKYEINEPQDIVDKIISDLKGYTKSLIYEDTSLAQEIEKYLQDKRNQASMKKDRQEAAEQGLDAVPLEDQDLIDFREEIERMKQKDRELTKEKIIQENTEGE